MARAAKPMFLEGEHCMRIFLLAAAILIAWHQGSFAMLLRQGLKSPVIAQKRFRFYSVEPTWGTQSLDQFFVTISNNNYEMFSQILKRDPALADSTKIKDGDKVTVLAQVLTAYNHPSLNPHGIPSCDKLKFVQELLDSGAQVNRLSKRKSFPVEGNFPALSYAALYSNKNSPEIIKLLIEREAEVNFKERKSGRTALHLLMMYPQEHQKEIAELLIREGAKINIRDKNGNTPFDFIINKYTIDSKHIPGCRVLDLEFYVTMLGDMGLELPQFSEESIKFAKLQLKELKERKISSLKYKGYEIDFVIAAYKYFLNLPQAQVSNQISNQTVIE